MPQPHLVRVSLLRATTQRDTLLQHLHRPREFLDARLSDQQRNMLGHHHVPGDDEVVLRSHLFQNFQKEIATADGIKKLPPPITATGNEMPVTGVVEALQAFWHG